MGAVFSGRAKKKKALSLKFVLPTLGIVPLLVGCVITSFVLVTQSKNQIDKVTSNSLYATAISKGEAFENALQGEENILKAFGLSAEVVNYLKSPNDEELKKIAQQYTLDFFGNLEGWEGLYIADWNSVVLAHPAEAVIGKQMREGDSLKELQDAMLNAENGVYNVGIIVSPASGIHTSSMYMAVYDGDKPIGYVGGGVFVNAKIEAYADVSSLGIESAYSYVVDKDGNFAYHPKEEKIGTEVTNAFVKGVMERINAGEHPESECITYTNEVVKYASYYVSKSNNWIFVVTGNKSDAMSASNKMIISASILSTILVIICASVSAFAALRIAKPVIIASKECEEFASGNLYGEFTETSKIQEISNLIQNLAFLKGKVKEVVSDIQTNVQNLVSNSDNLKSSVDVSIESVSQISDAIEDVAQGNSSLASNVSNQMASVEELGANIDESDNEITTVRTITETTVELSRQAHNLMNELIEITNKTKENVDSISEQSQKNVAAAEKINSITEAISDITSQTNLLSLNASIEAARAGETGKGFAVVADEIRKLADNSDQQTDHIKEIIQELFETIEESNDISNALVESANTQLAKLDITRETFNKVITQIREIETNVVSVSGNMDNITDIKDSVTDIAESLSAVSQETSASSEQVSASAVIVKENMSGLANVVTDLESTANQLEQAVSYFKSQE